MATLKDVARRANVSVSTASYALNNRPETKLETREKVLKAAQELNYTINGNARDLQRGATNICALVLSNMSGPFFSELIRGVEDESYDAGYDLIVATTNQIYRGASFRIMEENRADGYLVFSQFVDAQLLHRIGTRSPIVLIDRKSDDEILSSVTIDNRSGAETATRYLIDNGHRNIMFLGGSHQSYNNQERLDGFIRVMKENSLNFDDIHYADYSEKMAHELTVRRFRDKKIPDAIFSANDQMVLGIYKAAEETGLRIPEDLSVVGFDDAEFARYLTPSLTTIRQPGYLQGRNAAKKLFALLEGKEVELNDPPLATELVKRNSVMFRGGGQ